MSLHHPQVVFFNIFYHCRCLLVRGTLKEYILLFPNLSVWRRILKHMAASHVSCKMEVLHNATDVTHCVVWVRQ